MQQFPSTLDRETFNKLKIQLNENKRKLDSIRAELNRNQSEKPNSIDDPNSILFSHSAREEILTREITELEKYLNNLERNNKIIDIKSDSDMVSVNDLVTVRLLYSDDEEETIDYKLVAFDPDYTKNEISTSSDIGAAIIGKKVGDTVTTIIKNSGLTVTIRILSKI